MKPKVAPVTNIKPLFAPYRALLLNETRLTGPGDIDAAKANSAIEMITDKVITYT